MRVLAKKYNEYKASKEAYVAKRIELLKEPEEELSALSEDLNLFGLRAEVEKLLRNDMKRAWNLYRRIYNGSPTEKDIDKFLELTDEIMLYEDFVSADQQKVWRVSRDLIWAYKTAFKGTQDELDQTSIGD